jgi:sRNA-binding protein
MTKQRYLLTTTFRQLVEAFPHAFFTKGADVQPLKIGIAAELLAALPPGVGPHEAKRFLGWYVNRPGYLKALARGAGRVDLTGVVMDTDMPEAVR